MTGRNEVMGRAAGGIAAPSLRAALALDAAASGAAGAVMLAGAAMLPFAPAVGLPTRRAAPPRGLAWAVVAVNEAWVVASVALLLGPWVAPSGLGVAFVLGQAAVVAVFAVLQALALRRGG